MHVQTPTDWRRDNGFTHPYKFHPLATDFLLTANRLETKLVYDGEEDELFRLKFPSGRQLVGHWGASVPSGECRLYAKGPDAEPTPHDFWETLWGLSSSVKMVTDDEGTALESYSPFDESSSYGLGKELIERWKRFLAEGIDRSVYLYGEENGEKLSFCDTAARTLGDRIIRLDGGHIDVDELPVWSRVLEAVAPEVVIVEEATGFLNFRPGSATYRTVTAFLEQCREARLALFCGEERDDGWRLGLRPPLADEFQEFHGEESQDSEDSDETPRSPAARRDEGWLDLDEVGVDCEVWRNHRAIQLSSVSDRLVAQTLDLENVQYRGPHHPLREAVSEYQGMGVTRVSRQILLRGPVGTGKTTLAFDIAHNSSDRTIVLDAAARLTMDFDTWQDILRRSMPSMVIFAGVTSPSLVPRRWAVAPLRKIEFPEGRKES